MKSFREFLTEASARNRAIQMHRTRKGRGSFRRLMSLANRQAKTHQILYSQPVQPVDLATFSRNH